MVELEGDPTFAAAGRLGSDPLDHCGPEVSRGYQKATEFRFASEPGQHVEQVGEVGADCFVGGEQPEVFVETGGLRVVVAGADVCVAPQPVALATHHQRDLGVGLESGDAVHDVNPGLFEQPGPQDVRFLVEPGTQFDQHDDLFAISGGGDQ